MTTRQYRRMCRIKVTYYSRLITWIIVLLTSVIMPTMGLPEWLYISLPITLWFWMPMAVAYILESLYKIKHTHNY